jgi:hypothetical protein
MASLTPEDVDKANSVIRWPEFWCRAKLFTALEAAKEKGVLRECLEEIDIPPAQVDWIERWLDLHWK